MSFSQLFDININSSAEHSFYKCNTVNHHVTKKYVLIAYNSNSIYYIFSTKSLKYRIY